jgi:type IV secretion system protein VirB10
MSEPLIVEPGAHRPRGVPPRGLMALGLGAFTLAGMLWYLWSEDTAPPPDSSAQMRERLRVAAQAAARGSPASVDEAAQRAAQQALTAPAGPAAGVNAAGPAASAPTWTSVPAPLTREPAPNATQSPHSRQGGRPVLPSTSAGSGSPAIPWSQEGTRLHFGEPLPMPMTPSPRAVAAVADPAQAERERSARESKAVVFDRSAGAGATRHEDAVGLQHAGVRVGDPLSSTGAGAQGAPDQVPGVPDAVHRRLRTAGEAAGGASAAGNPGAEIQSAMLQLLRSYPGQAGRTDSSQDQRERWAQRQVSALGGEPSLPHPPPGRFVLRAGRVIPAVLTRELASHADGTVTARTTQHVYDTDGHLLVPMGTEFIGRHDSQVSVGQTRLVAVFTQMRLPNGHAFALPAAPVSDELGRAGAAGTVDRHFFRSFGAALLLGVLADRVSQAGKAPSVAGWGGSGAVGTSGLSATGQVFVDTARVELERAKAIAPTITVPAGSIVHVEVVRDMVFPGVYGQWGQ